MQRIDLVSNAQLTLNPSLVTLSVRSLLTDGALTGLEFVLVDGTTLGTDSPVVYTQVDAV